MKLLLQILFLLLTWFTNLSAKPVFTKVAILSYELSYPKTENVEDEIIVKIGVQNFAVSGISKNSFSQKENAGKAVPLTLLNDYNQYVNKYDTECAFFLGMEYLAMYAETVFEPIVIANAIGKIQKLAKTYKSFKGPKGSIDDLLKKNSAGVQGAGNIFKVGDNVAGKIIQKVLPGSNGKVAIVGRKMAGHVEDAAATLRAEGKQVEIFSELDQKNNLFNINGTNKSWQDIVDDFGNKSGQYLTNDKGWILDSELPKTMMYKANKIWADKLKAQGYTVIDIGYPSGANLPQSLFYNMEISTLFP